MRPSQSANRARQRLRAWRFRWAVALAFVLGVLGSPRASTRETEAEIAGWLAFAPLLVFTILLAARSGRVR